MRTPNLERALRAPRRTGAAWIVAALVAGCGGGEALLIPFFTFGFGFTGTVNGSAADIFLNLTPTAPTVAEGSFAADATFRLNTDTYALSGTFSGCSMTLNLAPIAPASTVPVPLAARYAGRFTNKDTIELSPEPAQAGRPVLTLTRSFGTDSRSQTC